MRCQIHLKIGRRETYSTARGITIAKYERHSWLTCKQKRTAASSASAFSLTCSARQESWGVLNQKRTMSWKCDHFFWTDGDSDMFNDRRAAPSSAVSLTDTVVTVPLRSHRNLRDRNKVYLSAGCTSAGWRALKRSPRRRAPGRHAASLQTGTGSPRSQPADRHRYDLSPPHLACRRAPLRSLRILPSARSYDFKTKLYVFRPYGRSNKGI